MADEFAGELLPRLREQGDDAGDRDLVHVVEAHAEHLEIAVEARVERVGGIGAVGGHAPLAVRGRSIAEEAKGGLGVADINCEEHVMSLLRAFCVSGRTCYYRKA